MDFFGRDFRQIVSLVRIRCFRRGFPELLLGALGTNKTVEVRI